MHILHDTSDGRCLEQNEYQVERQKTNQFYCLDIFCSFQILETSCLKIFKCSNNSDSGILSKSFPLVVLTSL